MATISRRFLCVWLGAAFIAGLWGCGSEAPPRAEPKAEPSKSTATLEPAAAATTESSKPVELTVAAAADLKFALDEIITEFQTTHPNITIKATYGSSGTLFAQISNDAPFDIYLSADMKYARDLAEKGKGAKEAVFPYAVGYVVVWALKTSDLDVEQLGIQAVVDERVKKVAIANPKHAPYGRAAEAAMKSLGVYEQVGERLVLGENISQTAQFVESGAADVGIIALSLALAPAMKDKGRFWRIPPTTHPELLQGGLILNRCENQAAAKVFQAHLTGVEGRRVLQKYGFGLP